MEIRTIPLEDLETFRYIHTHSFGRGEPSDYSEEDLAREQCIGVYTGGRLQATLGIYDFQMFFETDRRPCGGVTSVTCDPAVRGRGYAGALVKRSLEIQRKGQYLSSLWPFDHRFYRGYGYEWTGAFRVYKVPLNLLRSEPETRYVEGLYDAFEETLNPIYEAMATRYNGPLARDSKMWNHNAVRYRKRKPGVYVYRRDGQAEGYAIVRFRDKKEEAWAQVVALTLRAYQGILGLFHHHAMTVEKFEWWMPTDDPMWTLLTHWDVETKLEPAGMGRIVDVRAALSTRKPDPTVRGTVVFALQDEHAPWNRGTWKVALEGGHVEVSRTDEAPGVTLDIQALTQAYWGDPSLSDLRHWERVTVHKEEDFAVLSALLPPHKVWLGDEF